MRYNTIITVTCIVTLSMLSLTCGCRTTEDFVSSESLTGRPAEILSHQSATGHANSHEGAATSVSEYVRRSDRPAGAEQPAISQVAFRYDLNNVQPPLSEPPVPTPEPLPTPPTDHFARSHLTLQEMEGIAIQNNPAVAQASAQVAAARGNWVQVGLRPNPRIGYVGEEMGDDGRAGQQGGFVAQEFITGGKLGLNRQVADWEVQRMEIKLEEVRLRVLTDVRIGFYDVLIAQRRRDLAADLVRISDEGLQAADALFKGDEVSEADPLRARVEADSARILLQTASNQHMEAWRRLTAVLGMPELALERLDGELNSDNLTLSWDETLRRVLSESPEIAAAMADFEATQATIQRAYAEVKPNVDVQAGVQKDNATQNTIASLQIELPIPILNHNQGRIQQAEAEAAAAERAVDRLALDLQTRLAAAFQRYESARNQVQKYSQQDGILENARRTLVLIRTGYEAEEFSLLDLLAAQRTDFQTNLTYLDALRELWVSTMEIRGLMLKDSLQD